MQYIAIVLSLFLSLSIQASALTQTEKDFARDLNLHPSIPGYLSPNIERVYKFTAVNDGTVDIYTTGSTDTYGYLYMPDSSTVLEEDDTSESRNFSFKDVRVEKGKTYYVVVTGYGNSQSGYFHIKFEPHYEDANDEFPQTQWITNQFTNNETRVKTLEMIGATSIKVTVYGSTEENYDFVTIKDQNGKIIEKLSGNIDKEFIVDGSKIIVELFSDSSVISEGVTVSISAYDGQGDIPTSKKLDVIALNQHDYQFNIDGVDYSVIGCVPTTYAMMIDYYAKQRANFNLDIRMNISSLLQLYSDNDILEKEHDGSTSVTVGDEKFVNLLSHYNLVFNNLSMASYVLTLNRNSTQGWSYNDFMSQVKQNINQNKPIALSVVLFQEIDGWFEDYYKIIGGHHMLIVGYNGDTKLFVNDTWDHQSSTWEKVDFNTGYNIYTKDGDIASASELMINTNIAFKLGNYIAVVRTHSASFNIPEYILWYDF